MDNTLNSWRKSSHSLSLGQCVEVGQGAARIAVRDTRLADSPVLAFSGEAWKRFVGEVKRDAGAAY